MSQEMQTHVDGKIVASKKNDQGPHAFHSHLQPSERIFVTDAERHYGIPRTETVSNVQEVERRRIAADLHDGLGQILTVLSIDLRHAKLAAAASDMAAPALTCALERACACARQAIDELRRSVVNLYPSILDDLGLVASMSSILREVRETEPGLCVTSHITVLEKAIPKALHIVVFRIMQEAVNNVLKHAKAGHLTVEFNSKPDFLSLIIEDDGCGIAQVREGESGLGTGIEGMIRRAHASGGTLQINSASGRGTRIAVGWRTAMLS